MPLGDAAWTESGHLNGRAVWWLAASLKQNSGSFRAKIAGIGSTYSPPLDGVVVASDLLVFGVVVDAFCTGIRRDFGVAGGL